MIRASTEGTKMNVTNIEVGISSVFNRRAAASWHMGGARFHVWFDFDTKEMDRDGIIYKNPLTDDRKHPDHFDTRKLDADVPKNAEIIKHVFAEIDKRGLISVALAAEAKKERERQANEQERQRIQRIKDASLELFDALTVIRNNLGLSREECRDIAEAAIAKTGRK